VTERFLESLTTSYGHEDFFNIATEMLVYARSCGEPEPQKHFPELTDHQRNVEAHYRELVRLTKLLEATLLHGIKRSSPKRGPKPNLAVLHLIMSSSVFWTVDLRRAFTIDYHEGAGLTRAFEFVQTLLRPLDDVADKRIITAMRTEIAERGKRNIAPLPS